MEPWHLALAVIGMMITAAVSVFAAGKFAGRVEVAVGKVEALQAHLDRIPAIEQAMRFTETRLSRIESHHRELAEKSAEMRGRLASVHDGE